MNPGKLADYCLCLGLETPNQPAPTLPALLATAQPPALVTALAEENLKNRDSDSSGRESAELDMRQSRAGKVPLANILVLNLVARSVCSCCTMIDNECSGVFEVSQFL